MSTPTSAASTRGTRRAAPRASRRIPRSRAHRHHAVRGRHRRARAGTPALRASSRSGSARPDRRPGRRRRRTRYDCLVGSQHGSRSGNVANLPVRPHEPAAAVPGLRHDPVVGSADSGRGEDHAASQRTAGVARCVETGTGGRALHDERDRAVRQPQRAARCRADRPGGTRGRPAARTCAATRSRP